MTWKNISDYCVIAIAIAALILSSISFFRKDHNVEVNKMVPINGVSYNRYGVAGGGSQYVITLSGDTATYEVVVTEVTGK